MSSMYFYIAYSLTVPEGMEQFNVIKGKCTILDIYLKLIPCMVEEVADKDFRGIESEKEYLKCICSIVSSFSITGKD